MNESRYAHSWSKSTFVHKIESIALKNLDRIPSNTYFLFALCTETNMRASAERQGDKMPCSEHKKKKKGDCASCGICKLCPPAPSCQRPHEHVRIGVRGKRPYNSIVKVGAVRVSERKKKQDKLEDVKNTSIAQCQEKEKLDTVQENESGIIYINNARKVVAKKPLCKDISGNYCNQRSSSIEADSEY